MGNKLFVLVNKMDNKKQIFNMMIVKKSKRKLCSLVKKE